MSTADEDPLSWQRVFCPRDAEMKALQEAYESVADPNLRQARVVALVGEAGYGKTRLIQWFYSWLSTAKDGVGNDGYWPDDLERDGTNLTLNPSGCNRNNKPRFIWAATRLPNPRDRNAIAPIGLQVGLVEHVFDHATDLYRRREAERIAAKQSRVMAEALVDVSLEAAATWLPGGSLMLSLARKVLEAKRLRGESEELASFDSSNRKRQKTEDLSEQFLDALRDMYDPKERYGRGIPIVLFVDDAQWLHHDPGLSGLIRRLIPEAQRHDWPVLIVITSRLTEWNKGLEIHDTIIDAMPNGWSPLVLEKHKALLPILDAAFPGELEPHHAQTILDKADGNPWLLDQLIVHLKLKERYHLDRDRNKPLNPIALEKLRDESFKVHELIEERLVQADTAGGNIYNTLALSSAQGSRFVTSLTQDVLDSLELRYSAKRDVDDAVDPYGLVVRDLDDVAEFSQNVVYDVVRRHLDSDFPADVPEVYDALAKSLSDRLDADERQSEVSSHYIDLLSVAARFDDSDDQNHRNLAARALATLAGFLYERADIQGAYVNAQQFKEGWQSGRWGLHHISCGTSALVMAVLLEFDQPKDVRPFALEALKIAREGDYSPDSLAFLIDQVGEVEFWDGRLSDAERLWSEARTALLAVTEERGRRNFTGLSLKLSSIALLRGNYLEANSLIDEALEMCRARSKAANDEAGVTRDLAVALSRAAEVAFQNGDLDLAHARCCESEALFRRVFEWDNSWQSSRDLSVCLTRLSDLERRRGAPVMASELLNEAVSVGRSAVNATAALRARRDLAVTLGYAADAALEWGDRSRSQSLQDEALSLARELAERRATPDDLETFAHALSRAGDLAFQGEDVIVASGLYSQALSIRERLATQIGTIVARRNEANSLHSLSALALACNELDNAESLENRAHAIDVALADQSKSPRASRAVASSLRRLGDIAYQRDDSVRAERLQREALEIDRCLDKQSRTVQSRRDLLIGLGRVGMLALQRGDIAEAQLLNSEELEIARGLDHELGTPETRRDLALALVRRHVDPDQWSGLDTRARWDEALQIFRALARTIGSGESLIDLASQLRRAGDYCISTGDASGADKYWLEAVDVYRRAIGKVERHPAGIHFELCLVRLGDLYADRGDIVEAERLWLEALELAARAISTDHTPTADLRFAIALGRVGDLAQRRGDHLEAERRWSEALSHLRDLAKGVPSSESLFALSRALGRLGDLSAQRGNVKEAEQRWEEALETNRSLCRLTEEIYASRYLSLSLSRLGEFASDQNDSLKAHTLFAEAIEINRLIASRSESASDQLNLCESVVRGSASAIAASMVEDHISLSLEAVTIARRVVAELGTWEALALLSRSLGNAADVTLALEEWPAADEISKEALRADRALFNEFQDPESKARLLISLRRLAVIEHHAGHEEQADELWGEAQGLAG